MWGWKGLEMCPKEKEKPFVKRGIKFAYVHIEKNDRIILLSCWKNCFFVKEKFRISLT